MFKKYLVLFLLNFNTMCNEIFKDKQTQEGLISSVQNLKKIKC